MSAAAGVRYQGEELALRQLVVAPDQVVPRSNRDHAYREIPAQAARQLEVPVRRLEVLVTG